MSSIEGAAMLCEEQISLEEKVLERLGGRWTELCAELIFYVEVTPVRDQATRLIACATFCVRLPKARGVIGEAPP